MSRKQRLVVGSKREHTSFDWNDLDRDPALRPVQSHRIRVNCSDIVLHRTMPHLKREKWASMKVMGRFRRFARRHDRLLSVAGAFIIFVTFLVREGYRDELKELVDSIDGARNVFLIRPDNRDIAEQVARLQESLGAKYPQYVMAPSNVLYRSFTESIMSSLDLLDKVPHDVEFDKELSNLSWRRDKWMTAFLRPIAPLPEGPIVRDKAKEAADKAIDDKLWMEASSLDNDTLFFGARVVDMARKAKVEKEQKYRTSKRIYFCLFAIGWGFAVIGKDVGVEGLGAST
jgi:hypothetical protein